MPTIVPSPSISDIQAVAPVLARYAAQDVIGTLWSRPQLSLRDRSIVTLAVLIARNHIVEMEHYLTVALDNGVKPAEISEIISHLAFYSGWGNAMAAIAPTRNVFAKRGVTAAQLPAASPPLLPLNEAAEAQRATSVEKNIGTISPGLVQFTADPLFLDLWQRPDLTPRDRSLVTVTSLIASGQSGQITYHLNRAMDNGLTAEEAGEVLAHVAFYAGWPNAFSATTVFGEVFRSRTK